MPIFWLYSEGDDWSDGKMLPLPTGLMQMWPSACSIDYSFHLVCVFKPFLFSPSIVNYSLCCVLFFPSMLGLFPWVTQTGLAARSKPKVLLQTDSLFMHFTSINGPLSPDREGHEWWCNVIHIVLFRNTAVTVVVVEALCRDVFLIIVYLQS